VIGQPDLVKKVVFPLELLPLVPVCSTFVESSLGLMVLILLVGITSQVFMVRCGCCRWSGCRSYC